MRHRPGVFAQRCFYAFTMLLILSSGLLWRFWVTHPFLAKYGADALWAMMIFFGISLLAVRPLWHRALIALILAWAIEFLQLHHAPWIDALRATRIGALALGAVFNAPDLLAYMVGIGVGVLIDLGAMGRRYHW